MIIVDNFLDFSFCKFEAGEFVKANFSGVTKKAVLGIDEVRNRRENNVFNLVKVKVYRSWRRD